jgi:hypothetical protein
MSEDNRDCDEETEEEERRAEDAQHKRESARQEAEPVAAPHGFAQSQEYQP